MKERPRWGSKRDWKRYSAIRDMRQSGKTLREVGIAFGISPERVRRIVNDIERYERDYGSPPIH